MSFKVYFSTLMTIFLQQNFKGSKKDQNIQTYYKYFLIKKLILFIKYNNNNNMRITVVNVLLSTISIYLLVVRMSSFER